MYYTPSGKISIPLAFVGAIGVFLASSILSFVYTYAVWYIPFIYINFFITFFTGVGAFLVIKKITRFAKSRNKVYNTALGLLAGLTLFYINWVVWVDLVANSSESYNAGNRIGFTVSSSSIGQLIALFTHPGMLWEAAWQINAVGTWGIRGATISGGFLTVFWVIEAAMLVGVPVLSSLVADIEPFDEASNEWAEKQEAASVFDFIEDPQALKTQLEARNYAGLQALQVKSDSAINYSQLTAYYIATGDVFYLSITNQKGKYDKEGKLEHTSSDVVNFIEVPRKICQELLNKTTRVETPVDAPTINPEPAS